MTSDENYWVEYFEKVCKTGPEWIDYSNERVQLQTFGAVIEASDRLVGRRVLDIGCGRGALCRMAKTLGAAQVTGVDRVEAAVEEHRKAYPDIAWRGGDIGDAAFRSDLGKFDAIYLLEVMQYLPVPDMFDWVWSMLDPGGVVVMMFPHERCPIVQRTTARFDGKYVPPPLEAISRWIAARADVDAWGARGLRFQEDQSIVPYELGAWMRSLEWASPPNRVQLVLKKSSGAR